MIPNSLEIWGGVQGELANKNPILIPFSHFDDGRGSLSIIDQLAVNFFSPQRIFFQYRIPEKTIRGEHAHKTCQQIIVSLTGSCRVTLENSFGTWVQELRPLEFALFIPEMTWSAQDYVDSGSSLLVLASREFEEDDYIRNYLDFKRALNG
jgi:hypothetical protein